MTGVSSEYDTRDRSVKNILGKLQPWRNVSFTWDLVLLVLKFYYDRKTPSECQGWAEVQLIVLFLFPRGKFFWTTHLCLRRLVQGEGHALCSCHEPASPFPLLGTGQNRVSLADGVVFARLTTGGGLCYMGLVSASFFLLGPWVYISLAFTWVSCTKKY